MNSGLGESFWFKTGCGREVIIFCGIFTVGMIIVDLIVLGFTRPRTGGEEDGRDCKITV